MIDPTMRFKALVGAAMVDGQIQPEEEVLLLNSAKRMGLPLQETYAIMKRIPQDLNLWPPVPPDPGDRVTLFMEIADILAADGILRPEELALLTRIAPRFGFRPEQVNRIAEQAKISTAKLLKILSQSPP